MFLSCTFQKVLSSVLFNFFATAKKRVSFLLTRLKWACSTFILFKKFYFLNFYRRNKLLWNRISFFFETLILLSFGFSVPLWSLIQVSFRVFFCPLYWHNINIAVLEPIGTKSVQWKTINQNLPQRLSLSEIDIQIKLISSNCFFCNPQSFWVGHKHGNWNNVSEQNQSNVFFFLFVTWLLQKLLTWFCL